MGNYYTEAEADMVSMSGVACVLESNHAQFATARLGAGYPGPAKNVTSSRRFRFPASVPTTAQHTHVRTNRMNRRVATRGSAIPLRHDPPRPDVDATT
jgi:hypothetical protein